MDPVTAVGLAASACQLAAVAKDVVSNIYKYYDAVKDAPKNSRELRQELGAVSDLLDSLEDILVNSSAKFPSTGPDSFQTAITEFQEILKEIRGRVAKPQTEGSKRLRWPFTKAENERLLFRIERYKATFNLALNINLA
jgi:hypothetical protein